MVELETIVHVEGLDGERVFDFLTSPTDEKYRAWWPGTHLACHMVRGNRDLVGSVIHMDEFIGRRRLRINALVKEAEPGRRLVLQMIFGFRLPVRLTMSFENDAGGVRIAHAIRAGFPRTGRILDPLFRFYLSRRFAADMDEHARTEFGLMRRVLPGLV
jgi:uncharacterized protein YndB with AHSA1/START domain